MNILVTGGAGYIGSHTTLRLLEAGHAVTAVDNFTRGNHGAIDVLTSEGDDRFQFIEADIADTDTLTDVLHSIDLVMHFAALANVGESVQEPLHYYRNNTAGTIALLSAMEQAKVTRLVFSSTCATYGEPPAEHIPIRENCHQQPINPYGRSKLQIEQVLFDHAAANDDFAFAALRYFNVAGCDRQGRLGEDHDPETHLIPICLQAALGQRDGITIFGTDYDTPDGTCIRDYVHIEDLADAHIAAMHALSPGETLTYNVGIGEGTSVREIIDSVKRVTRIDLPIKEGSRRPGDPPTLFADPSKIRNELGWLPQVADLDEIVASAWQWFEAHPQGY